MTHRILVVDDDEALAQLMRDGIEDRTHYEVVVSLQARVAVDLFQQSRFDLVVCDIRMPGMNGVDLLKTLKSMDPEVEVIMLTGSSSYQTAVDCLKYRAYDYIEKPVDLDVLLQVIGNALSRQELNREFNRMLDRLRLQNGMLRKKLEGAAEDGRERPVTVHRVQDEVRPHLVRAIDQLLKLESVIRNLEPGVADALRSAFSGIGDSLDSIHQIMARLAREERLPRRPVTLRDRIEAPSGSRPDGSGGSRRES